MLVIPDHSCFIQFRNSITHHLNKGWKFNSWSGIVTRQILKLYLFRKLIYWRRRIGFSPITWPSSPFHWIQLRSALINAACLVHFAYWLHLYQYLCICIFSTVSVQLLLISLLPKLLDKRCSRYSTNISIRTTFINFWVIIIRKTRISCGFNYKYTALTSI